MYKRGALATPTARFNVNTVQRLVYVRYLGDKVTIKLQLHFHGGLKQKINQQNVQLRMIRMTRKRYICIMIENLH